MSQARRAKKRVCWASESPHLMRALCTMLTASPQLWMRGSHLTMAGPIRPPVLGWRQPVKSQPAPSLVWPSHGADESFTAVVPKCCWHQGSVSWKTTSHLLLYGPAPLDWYCAGDPCYRESLRLCKSVKVVINQCVYQKVPNFVREEGEIFKVRY